MSTKLLINGQLLCCLLELLPEKAIAGRLLTSTLLMPLLDLPGKAPDSLERLLGPYPILQFAAAAIVVVVTAVGALAWLKGEKWGKASAEADKASGTQTPAVQLYFDGPLKAIFETLNDIKGRQLVGRLEIKDDFAALLSSSRHSLLDKMMSSQSEIIERIAEVLRDHDLNMDNRFRDLNNVATNSTDRIETNVNSVHQRLDLVLQALGRIEGAMEHRSRSR